MQFFEAPKCQLKHHKTFSREFIGSSFIMGALHSAKDADHNVCNRCVWSIYVSPVVGQ